MGIYIHIHTHVIYTSVDAYVRYRMRTCQKSVDVPRTYVWLGFLSPPLSGLVWGCQKEVEIGGNGVCISSQYSS